MTRLNNAPCGYLAFDDSNVLLDVNREGAAWLRRAPEELRGRPLSDLFGLSARMFFSAHVLPQLAEAGRAEEVYISLVCADGSDLPVLLSFARRNDGGAAINEAVFLPIRRRQVFERLLADAQIKEVRTTEDKDEGTADAQDVRANLELSERLAALGLLAAGVAHEINNPLTYVQGNLDILALDLAPLKDRVPELAEDLTALDEAQLGVRRIREMVAALRVLSRVSPNRRVPVELSEVVNVAVRLVRHEIMRKGRLEVDVASPNLRVMGDESRLGQVVMNLLLNAAQALESDRSAGNVVKVATHLDGDRALIDVLDNGPGVPAEIRKRIFDPFFTTKPVGVGTGLGLSICHQIVSSLGGMLTLEEAPTEGAHFRVSLPAA